MTRTAIIHNAALSHITVAASIEEWMIEAIEQTDAALTAHAILNAAIEAIADITASLDAYADGIEMPMLAELRAMHSALRNVIAWATQAAA
jgi:hypothetical protein